MIFLKIIIKIQKIVKYNQNYLIKIINNNYKKLNLIIKYHKMITKNYIFRHKCIYNRYKKKLIKKIEQKILIFKKYF